MGPTTRIRLGIGEYTEKIINGLIWVNWSWSFGTWFQNKPCPFESLAEPDILCHWVYIGYPCRSNGRPWAQIVWLWSLGVWFGVELNLETRITKSLVSLLDSNFVLTPESRVSFDWNLQSSPTYTPTFVPLMLFDFLVSEVVAVLSGKCFTTRCWWPHLHTKQLARCLISRNLFTLVMPPYDDYDMDENGSFYRAQQNMTPSARKSLWVQPSEGCPTLALVINTTCSDTIVYKSLGPKYFGSWLPTNYMWWFANQMSWMTSYVFDSWMMSVNGRFKS